MNQPLLTVNNLTVEYHIKGTSLRGVDDLSFSLHKGESFGIIGESGSGKTSMAMAIMGLIKSPCKAIGNIVLDGKEINGLSQKDLELIRWKKIAIVFQNSLDILNPLLRIYEQLYEVMAKHTDLSKGQINEKIALLLTQVGLEPTLSSSYPHELSGGMRQRVLIAMALSCDPDVLIVDEPTSALDMVSKNQIIGLLSQLHKEKQFAMLVISHELDTVLQLTSNLGVMYGGFLVEKGMTKDVIENPKHSYTKGLLNASPAVNPFGDMWGIPGERAGHVHSGCPFQNRCTQSIDLCKKEKPSLEHVEANREVACNRGGIVTILKARDISKSFHCSDRSVTACNQCHMDIKSGEIVALIGESGSGKTTLASILSGMTRADLGEVLFEDHLVSGNNFTAREHGIQMVFQDPFSAINEKLTIGQAIGEPLKIIKGISSASLEREIANILRDVQLPSDAAFISRKCHTLSGGQRQRVSLARSLMTKPRLLIADEISSMLDPSTQANILRLLKQLQNQKGFSMLYITHDLPLARKIADVVYVMSEGKIVEFGPTAQVFTAPKSPYTQRLIGAGISMF